MKLAIVGSRNYTNESKIRQIIEKYISQYGNLVIVSGGCPKGADFLGKKIALELNLSYEEYPPVHNKHNWHCVLPSENYNKPYNVVHFFNRNTQIAENCDHLAAFIIKDVVCNGTMDTVKKARKFNKKVFIFKDKL